MTARKRNPSTDALQRVARALRWSGIVQGAVWWGVISAGALLVLVVADDLLHLPMALRLPMAVVLCGLVLVGFYRRVLLPLARPLSLARAARMLEIRNGITGNVLINAYQFENQKLDKESRKFVRPVLGKSKSVLNEIRPRTFWWTPPFKKWLLAFVALVVVWTLGVTLFPRSVTTAVERIFLPLADVPPAGNWLLTVAPTGRVTLTEGDPLEVRVTVHSQSGSAKQPPVPLLVWKEGAGILEPSLGAGDRASMLAGKKAGEYIFTFSSVGRAFSFRVWADDSCSPATEVTISALPRLKSSVFEVVAPEYTGLKPYQQPGPPMALAVPAGSTVNAAFDLSPVAAQVFWNERGEKRALQQSDKHWKSTLLVNEARQYEIAASPSKQTPPHVLVVGEISAVTDHAPEVDFVTEDRNRLVNPGGTLPVVIRATDDYGVASIALTIARSDDPTTSRVLKTWTLMGPPGEKEPTPESYAIPLDPAVFIPGSSFLVTAQATDFSPAKQRAVSRPILVRVNGLKDLAVPAGDALEKLFALIKNAITEQTRGNGLTDNLALHLSEAIAAKDLSRHRDVISSSQKMTQAIGSNAVEEANKHEEAKAYQSRLQLLVKGEMSLALGQIDKIPGTPANNLKDHLATLQKRQSYILGELISMLGQMATDRQDAAARAKAAKNGDTTPPVTADKLLADLQDDLKKFLDEQKRIIDASKSLKELRPEDLTSEQEALLGELAREEAKNAAYFQEKLTDLSKLPLQDFADGKVVTEVNSVFQEVQAAAAALYEKKIEIAVPREEAGLELASELEQNLERWLPNTPDNIKWSMEEGAAQADAPMAELPKQLEDIVGDLLDKEENMGDDVDDVSSSFMDSLDKGAGWGAGDGPISNMSARGVTGNQLPNNNEVGGRSGEGRNGKSSGQMVEDSAEGKGGRETPTRLNATPFEQGSVNDKSKDNKGGATGGGKLSGSGEDGLHGPLPPPALQKMQRMAEQQAKLRQQAEALAVQLRKQRRPTGDLETAVNAMKQFESAAKTQNGIGVYQGYHQALDALASARTAYRGNRVSRVEVNSLGNSEQKDVSDTQAEGVPTGYEEMTGAYFRSLSESNSGNGK